MRTAVGYVGLQNSGCLFGYFQYDKNGYSFDCQVTADRGIQKKRRNIPSKPKAELIYKQLWNACREQKPAGTHFTHWGPLVSAYLEYVSEKLRSPENPLGFSPSTVRNKKGRLSHLKGWEKLHLNLITAKSVTDFLDEKELKGMSRANSNEILKEIKCVFAYGVFVGTLKTNPFSGMKMRKVFKKRLPALNHEEVDLLLGEAKRRQHPFYYIWLLTNGPFLYPKNQRHILQA